MPYYLYFYAIAKAPNLCLLPYGFDTTLLVVAMLFVAWLSSLLFFGPWMLNAVNIKTQNKMVTTVFIMLCLN
jgi:hypothetical protein